MRRLVVLATLFGASCGHTGYVFLCHGQPALEAPVLRILRHGGDLDALGVDQESACAVEAARRELVTAERASRVYRDLRLSREAVRWLDQHDVRIVQAP